MNETSVTKEPSSPVPRDSVFDTNSLMSSAMRWSGLSTQSGESCMRYELESCSHERRKRRVIHCRHRIWRPWLKYS